MGNESTYDAGAWVGAQLVDGLQVAAGAARSARELTSSLRSVVHLFGTVDWSSAPHVEFVVVRSILVTFCSRLVSHQPAAASLPLSNAVARIAAADARQIASVFLEALRVVAPESATVTRTPIDERVTTALSLLTAHCERRITVTELARAVGMSRWHLERLTKQHTGTSLRDHLRTARIRLATAIFQNEGLSVKEVAARTGYGSAGALARDFRRHHGQSPSDWVRSVKRPTLPRLRG